MAAVDITIRKELTQVSGTGARVVISVTGASDELVGQVAGIHDDYFWFVSIDNHPRLIRVDAVAALRPAALGEDASAHALGTL